LFSKYLDIPYSGAGLWNGDSEALFNEHIEPELNELEHLGTMELFNLARKHASEFTRSVSF